LYKIHQRSSRDELKSPRASP